ncbi:MAG: membrane alanine aminopeptidase [Hyphomonadaceae bacterium]|nr:MAG: membrane alanine aminopeptidase [Hyphomonadaceae bacterium]
MKNYLRLLLVTLALAMPFLFSPFADAEALRQTKGTFRDAFRQLDPEELPTPNDFRSASGAPGSRYWQQQVDYKIQIRLDETNRSLSGREVIKYKNNSPDTITYLWLLLDQNNYRRNSIAQLTRTTAETGRISFDEVRRMARMQEWEGGFNIKAVATTSGAGLRHNIVDTLLRIDLAAPLAPGQEVEFVIEFDLPMVDNKLVGGRSGYECFTAAGQDGNCIFEAAQWFPRLAVYSDYEGWHNKAFLGAGEFTLEFGSYDVEITVPSDFVVASTGELVNANAILSPAQAQRLAAARVKYDRPSFIVTPAEALAAQTRRATTSKTWQFRANNVRDFAWAGSRKFIWDAMGVRQTRNNNGEPNNVLAMSFYPNEAEPLWSTYSTQAIAHTINIYGRMAFPYPYPSAQSVNGPVGGMEYPMITFNGPRPVKDNKGNITYTDRVKYGLISVIIHEVGHIWFPMTVNSDERQWTWMDEGLNTFVQYIAEQEWSDDYPSRRGDPRDLTEYMVGENQVPIMTQSDSVLQLGNNAYGKPATALVILRETIMGRENFDRAFREYSMRWRFKRPTPADFFRTMEESSGVDLDWFWRGWFYSTDHVDIALTAVREGTIDTQNPSIEANRRIAERDARPVEHGVARVADIDKIIELHPELKDYYDSVDPLADTQSEREAAARALAALTQDERAVLARSEKIYVISLENKGGLVMPVILKFTFADNSSQIVEIPAEIWRQNAKNVNWSFMTLKTLTSVELDPRQETADADRNNNYFPPRIEPSRLQIFKEKGPRNQMRDNNLTVAPNTTQTSSAKEK